MEMNYERRIRKDVSRCVNRDVAPLNLYEANRHTLGTTKGQHSKRQLLEIRYGG